VKVRRTSSRDLDHGQRIILEEIRLGGRAVRESIEAMRMALEARLDQHLSVSGLTRFRSGTKLRM